MNKAETFNIGRVRFLTFAAVAILHVLIILLVAFNIETIIAIPEPVAGVMKLVDVEEKILPPERPVETVTNTIETIAETMIETDEAPPPPVVYTESVPVPVSPPEEIKYLQQHLVTSLAVLPDRRGPAASGSIYRICPGPRFSP